ncbi:MAG: hypothetical protein JL50_04510 [Peptococcaceae bacterium BICA1-7]|nr:MAG: hypothetical protein JL50_04510 [Peptococcaceae bacterium BICA1-7]
MNVNYQHIAEDDSAFKELLYRRGKALEEKHLKDLGRYQKPEFLSGDFAKGFSETIKLTNNKVEVIYQPVLWDAENGFLAIPDFLIFDQYKERYKIRDAKLAVDLQNHPEISLQLGLYRMLFYNLVGYVPPIEVLKGDGQIVDFEPATAEAVTQIKDLILSIRELKEEPSEPVGWSKCSQCVFFSFCWEKAKKINDIATVPYLDQGAWRELTEKGVLNYDYLNEFSEELLAELKRPWGGRKQKIGSTTARKIKRQVASLVSGEMIIKNVPKLPHSYIPGQRPIVILDIENDVFDLELGVKVYLWGMLSVSYEGLQEPKSIIANSGVEGDRQGWFDFLGHASYLFNTLGEVPFIHYSNHERTWIGKYIERHGDLAGVGQKILDNLWDMYACISNSFFLPVHSYGLKNIEKCIGFKRSQEEYGGLWSIVCYDAYINAKTNEEAQGVLTKILTYNSEDLLATWEIYTWLEKKHIAIMNNCPI